MRIIKSRLHLLVCLIGVVLLLSTTTGEGMAQPAIAIQASGGVSLPPLPAARNSIGLSSQRVEDGRTTGIPYLADRTRTTGLRFGVNLQLSSLEFGYAFERASWASEHRHCIGDRRVAEDDGRGVLDRAVRWDCSEDSERVDAGGDDFPTYMLHHVTAGYRWYPPTRGNSEVYLVGSGGITLTTFDRDARQRRIRVGPVAAVGAGFDLPVERSLALNVDVRYQLSLLPVTNRFSDNARRASAAGRPVTSAVFDAQHAIIVTLGFRVAFR